MASHLIQYVIVRSDLKTALQWPLGALIAQACHACTAVTHLFYQDPNMQTYLNDLDRMHKVVLEVMTTLNLDVFQLVPILIDTMLNKSLNIDSSNLYMNSFVSNKINFKIPTDSRRISNKGIGCQVKLVEH